MENTAKCITILTMMLISTQCTTGFNDWNTAKQLLQYNIDKGTLKGEIKEQINLSNNKTLINELRTTLNQYNFTRKYKEDVFDCTDTSQLTAQVLTDLGYRTKVVYTINNIESTPIGHMFVAVEDGDTDTYVEIETTWMSHDTPPIGRIANQSQYDYSHGWMLTTSELWNYQTPVTRYSSVTNQTLKSAMGTYVRAAR